MDKLVINGLECVVVPGVAVHGGTAGRTAAMARLVEAASDVIKAEDETLAFMRKAGMPPDPSTLTERLRDALAALEKPNAE